MIVEVALVSTSTGGTIAYELKNATVLGRYKTPVINKKNCCCFFANEVLLITEQTKPYLSAFLLNRADEELSCRMMLPAKSNVICSLPDATFLIIGIQNEVQVFHVASQQFYRCHRKHFQSISVIKSSADGSLFATGADDGQVIVWNTSRIFENAQDKSQEVYASFSDHTLSIRDLVFSRCNYKPMLVSTSNDRSVKIYDLNCKKLLLNVIFQNALSNLVFNLIDTEIFLGTTKGDIFKLDLSIQSRSLEMFEDSNKNLVKFNPCHSGEITSMVISSSNRELVTGSLDQKFIIWNITTGRAMQAIESKAPILSIIIARIPKSLFESSSKTAEILKTVRTIKKQDSKQQQEIAILDHNGIILITEPSKHKIKLNNNISCGEKEIKELMNINNELFHYYRKLIDRTTSS